MILLFGRFLQGRLVKEIVAERIESFKSGILAAIAFLFAYILIMLASSSIVASLARFNVVGVAIALASGFLFGVTYRYIIRGDGNSHLKDGAVLAFGLVRGLAAIEVSGCLAPDCWLPMVVLGGESLFCFFIARLTLDLGLSRGWIEPLDR
jgi:hypothetical protein